MTFLLETYVEALVQQQKTKPSNKALVSVGSRAYLPPQSPARVTSFPFFFFFFINLLLLDAQDNVWCRRNR